MPETRIYGCHGVPIASEIELPELAVSAGYKAPLAPGEPELRLRLAATPGELADAPPPVQGLQSAEGKALLTVPGVARYLVSGGTDIAVEPEAHAAADAVRLFLLGSALGTALHQRGVLPLHACCVGVGQAGYAFCGASGAGKSTLAGLFAGHGYRVLSDDVCAIRFADGAPLAWPASPQIKLWGEALTALGHDRAGHRSVRGRADKYHVPLAQAPAASPVGLRRLYLMSRATSPADVGIARLTGVKALQLVASQTYRREYIAPLGLTERHFALCSALLSRIEVFEIKRTWGLEVAERQFEMIRDHVEHDAAQLAPL